MAFDKFLAAVAPQSFLADGTTLGLITLDTPWLFKAHQTVVLRSNTQPAVELEVKRVLDGVLYVGPIDRDPKTRTDISNFLVVDGSTIEGTEQLKVFIPQDGLIPNFELEDYAFESEPTDAQRVLIVDLAGRAIDSTLVAGKRALVVNAVVSIALDSVPFNGASWIDTEALEKQTKLLVEYDLNGNAIFIGEAAPGSLSSAAVWRIKSITWDVNNNATSVTWADGNTNFDNIWDNRAILSYS